MKKLIAFLGASLMATAAFAGHYEWNEFKPVKVSYNTGGYYTMAQAEAAADTSAANLEAGILPSSEMMVWGASLCKDINSADSRQAVSNYIHTRREMLGAGWTRDDVAVYSADFKTTMANGRTVYYATMTARIPCVRMTASRRHNQ